MLKAGPPSSREDEIGESKVGRGARRGSGKRTSARRLRQYPNEGDKGRRRGSPRPLNRGELRRRTRVWRKRRSAGVALVRSPRPSFLFRKEDARVPPRLAPPVLPCRC